MGALAMGQRLVHEGLFGSTLEAAVNALVDGENGSAFDVEVTAKCGQRAITNSCSMTAIRRAGRTCERQSFYTFRTNSVTARAWRYGALTPLTTAPIVRIPPEKSAAGVRCGCWRWPV
jgi:hypothetical protein